LISLNDREVAFVISCCVYYRFIASVASVAAGTFTVEQAVRSRDYPVLGNAELICAKLALVPLVI
jgi:hypothetical protein